MGVLAWIHESSGVLPISVSGGEFNNRGIPTFPLGDYPQGHGIAAISPAERGRTATNHGIRGVLPQQCGPTDIAVTDAPDCACRGIHHMRNGRCFVPPRARTSVWCMPGHTPDAGYRTVPPSSGTVRPATHVAAYRTKRHRQDGTALQATTSPRDSATGTYGRPPIPHTSKTRSKRESPMHTGFGCMGLVRSRSALGSN
jgi:hypothetical protein